MHLLFSYNQPDFSSWQANSTLIIGVLAGLFIAYIAFKTVKLASKVSLLILALLFLGGSLPLKNYVFDKINSEKLLLKDKALEECSKLTGSKVGEGQCDF